MLSSVCEAQSPILKKALHDSQGGGFLVSQMMQVQCVSLFTESLSLLS